MPDINELISPKALEQIDTLIKKAGKGAEAMVKLHGEAQKVNTSLQGLSTTTKASKTHWDKLTTTQKEMLAIDKQTQKAIEQLNLAEKGYNKTLLETQNKLNQKKAAQRLAIKDNQAEAGSIQKLKTQMNLLNHKRERLNRNTVEGRRKFKEYNKAILRSEKQLKKFDAQIGRSQRHVGAYGRAFGGLTKMLGMFGVMLGGAMIVRGFANLIRLGSKFERQMSKVQAITSASGLELAMLRNNALLLGEATEKTASEVASLQIELGKLGLTSKQILDATGAILDMATAADAELGNAAKVAASTMKGFGKTVKSMNRIVDVMAKSFSSSALDIGKFETAMSVVAPVADNAGQSLEGATAQLSVLVDRGMEASTAGTSLRNIFLELSKQGISLNDALEKINVATDKNAVALELFGKRSSTAAVILAKNREEVERLTNVYKNSAGAAEQMANIMRDNLAGDADQARSALEGLGLKIMNMLNPALRSAVQGFTGVVRTISSWLTKSDALSSKIKDERDELNKLVVMATNDNTAKETRLRLIKEMQAKYPGFIDNIDAEKVSNEELVDALRDVNDQYKIKIAQALAQEKALPLEAEREAGYKRELEFLELIAEAKKRGNVYDIKNRIPTFEANIKLIQKRREEINLEIEAIYRQIKAFMELDKLGRKGPTVGLFGAVYATAGAPKPKEAPDEDLSGEVGHTSIDLIETLGINKILEKVDGLAGELMASISFLAGKANKVLADQAEEAAARVQEGFYTIERNAARNLIFLKTQYAEGLISKEEYDQGVIQNEFDKNEAILQAQVDHYNKLLQNSDLKGAERVELEGMLADAEVEIEQSKADRKLLIAQEAADQQAAIQRKLAQIGIAITDAVFDHYKHGLNKQLADVEAAKQYELELAGDNEKKQGEIEAKYAKKAADIKRKQAIADKANAIFRIAINTAVAAMAQASIPLAGFGLAAAIIALGAVQAAIVAAKPIPQFAKGTKSSPEGLAYTGEKGRELGITPSGEMFITQDQAQLTYLKKGTQIISNPETERLFAGARGFDSYEVMALAGIIQDGDERIVQAIRNKKEITIHARKGTITEREGKHFKTYLNSKIEA